MHPVLAVNKVSGRWPVALKAAIAVAGPVFIAALLGETTLGLMTGLGAFTVLYGPQTAGRFRLRLMSAVALALVASTSIGVLTHPWPWLHVPALVAIGVVAAIICGTLKVGPPGAYFFVLVAGVGGYAAQHGQSPALVIGMTAVGGAVATLVGLLDLLWAPRGAERKALAAAEKAVAGFERAEGPALAEARALASQSLHHAWTTVRDGSLGPRDNSIVSLLLQITTLQKRYERRSAMVSGELAGFEVHPWGALEGEEAPDDSQFADFSEEQLRDSSLGRPQPAYLLRRGLTWPSEMLLVGLRVGIAGLVAGGLALLVPVAHPYWAVTFAILILHQGGARAAQTVRGIQRLLGTAVGLGLYALVLLWSPQGVWVAVLMFCLQFAIELLVVRNYALAVMFITPLALTIASASAPVQPVSVVLERALDSLVAISIALVVLWLVGRGTALLLARSHARRVVVAADPVLSALAEGRVLTPDAAEQRRHLYFELLELQHMVNQSLSDEPHEVEPYRDMFRAVADLGYGALGAAWHPENHRVRAAAASARQALPRITGRPVSEYRPAADLLQDVDAVRHALRQWT